MIGKKSKGTFWRNGLLCLLLVLLFFTVISNAAASFTVAGVRVTGPSARKIQHIVTAEGRVEKNREISVLSQPDVRVERVQVNVGQRVKKGEVLAVLDLSDLAEQLIGVQDEKRALKLQNEALWKNQREEQKKRQGDISRAKKDYKQLQKKNKAAIARAKKEWDEARKEQRKAGAEKDSVDLQAVAEQKKKIYNETRSSARTKEKEAKKAIREAAVALTADNTIQVNNIAIEKLDRQIRKLTELKRKKGEVAAPKEGVITSILVNVGQKTADTGLFTMTDDKAGFLFEGQLSPEQAKYVAPGDSAILTTSDGEALELTVTSLELDESKEFLLVTVLLPAKKFFLGETVSMEVTQESQSYSCTVPLTALRQENGKYFVLVTGMKDTVMGEQMVAVREEVKLLESNETVAALECDSLQEDSQIIIDTDRYVEAGDRVRLKEE